MGGLRRTPAHVECTYSDFEVGFLVVWTSDPIAISTQYLQFFPFVYGHCYGGYDGDGVFFYVSVRTFANRVQ